MSLFQKSVLKHYVSNLDSVIVGQRYEKYKAFFHNLQIQQTIKDSKEEEFQYRFLQELFAKVLGYTIKPDEKKYNLVVEQKNESDSKKADGAVVINLIKSR